MDNQNKQDIAETLGNEAVLLEALEHVYDEICRISREVKGRGIDHVQARNMQDESLAHIRDTCALAIQSCKSPEPWTDAPDKVTEYNENRLSNMIIGMGLNKAV